MEDVFLIAPSRKCDKILLDRSVKVLQEMGFEPKYREDIISEFLGYYAGTPNRRALELNEALLDKGSSIVFCVRGGMGAVHILDKLDYEKISKVKKVFVGYSDITILLNVLYSRSNVRCFHGLNASMSFEDYHPLTISTFFDAYNKKDYSVFFYEEDILVEGIAEAEIIGGNLSLLGRTLGTPYEFDSKDKILFLEQNSYTGRMIYDILWQLKLAGKFDNIKGVILGDFTDGDENIPEYLSEFFRELNCPVIMNQPIGHKEPNVTIPLGENCFIDTSNKKWGIKFSQ
jgi:muramoyltetrapeptide carboxypeptidase